MRLGKLKAGFVGTLTSLKPLSSAAASVNFLRLKKEPPSVGLLAGVWSFLIRRRKALRTEQMCSVTRIKCPFHRP